MASAKDKSAQSEAAPSKSKSTSDKDKDKAAQSATPTSEEAPTKSKSPAKSILVDNPLVSVASSGVESLEKVAGALVDQLKGYGDAVAGGLKEVAKVGFAIPLMGGDNWLKDIYSKAVSPERLSAMADAGAFLRDARQVAGLNLQDMATALGLSDTELLEDVEQGRATLPFEMILRIAALIARHDPIPFILNFMRTYNPALEKSLDYWGITAFPKQFERERRFVNLIRKHDELRDMTDSEFDRFIRYQDSGINLTLEVMASEKRAARGDKRKPSESTGNPP